MSRLVEPAALSRKLVEGLVRLAAAAEVDRRRSAEERGLTLTQAHILRLLESRYPDGLRVGDIAAHLGVRQPTATDSIAALERKGFVSRRSAVDDGRATLVVLSGPPPADLAASPALEAAVGDLAPAQRVDLLRSVTTLIRALQTRGAIPPQRLCVTCRHFQPYRHVDANAPHHCAFVNAAFGDGELRLDCREHETAAPPVQAATWTTFDAGGAAVPPGS